MHDPVLQQDVDRLFDASNRRLKAKLARHTWEPNDWAVINRGNQDPWHGRSVIRMETAPDEIANRPGIQPKATYLTGS
jgi:hypothetical protein